MQRNKIDRANVLAAVVRRDAIRMNNSSAF
jgi:hypothetical protein